MCRYILHIKCVDIGILLNFLNVHSAVKPTRKKIQINAADPCFQPSSCTCVTAVVTNQGAFGAEGIPTQLTWEVFHSAVGNHMGSQDVGLELNKTRKVFSALCFITLYVMLKYRLSKT